MNKSKESILNDAKKGSGNTTNASNETTSAGNKTTNATNTATTLVTSTNSTTTIPRSNDIYIHGVGILAVLAIGVLCIFCI